MRDLPGETAFDVRGLDPPGAVIPVRDELDLLIVVPELLHDVHEHPDVLQAGDLERHEGEDDVGDVEHREDLLLERRPGVHDDVGVVLPKGFQDLLDVRPGDELRGLGIGGCEQDLDPRGVRHEDALEDLGVDLIERANKVGDRLRLRAHVEDHGDITEREAPVDQTDRLSSGLMEGDRKVRRDRGPADAALRGEERDDLPAGRPDAGPRRRAAAAGLGLRHLLVAGPLHLLDLVDVADGVHELIGGERLHQEFARAGEHRAPEVVLLALDAHHDDRRAGDGVRDDLGRGDPVHARHVDVHEDHIGALALGQLDGLLAAFGRGRDDHVRFK